MFDRSVVSDRFEKIDSDYQLVIIGGGIYGAALCWEAAHRGIKTILIEQEDYACGASSNSLKTIHGGLRSLQSLNLSAVIKGIRERSIFLRIAPNYIKPMPCALPTTGSLMKSRPVVGMGLLMYNVISRICFWRSKDGANIPNARLLSRSEFLRRAPGINPEGVTGGALWYDAQVKNTERVVWQFIKSAIEKGAVAINHTIAVKHEYDKSVDRHSVLVRDQITGDERVVVSSAIVDCSAAWNFIKHCLPVPEHDESLTFLKSVNIIVKKNIFNNAVGASVKAKKDGSSRLYFFSPWRDCTIVGTWYSSAEDYPENGFSYDEAKRCIDEINVGFDRSLLSVNDICNVHIGFLPAKSDRNSDSFTLDKSLLSSYQFKSWSDRPSMHNVYSFRGTKYTLARHDSKQVIDRLSKLMKWDVFKSRSDQLPIYQMMPVPDNVYRLSDVVVDHLLINYGVGMEQLFGYIKKYPQLVEIIPGTKYHIMAEIYYVVIHEQALTLSDLLKRRLDIGDCSPPDLKTAQYCATVMQKLLSWTDEVMFSQISELYTSYPNFLLRK